MQRDVEQLKDKKQNKMAVIETVFAMMMIVGGSMDGFMKTDGLSHCLKVKRESEHIYRQDKRTNVIRYECGLDIRTRTNSEGVKKLKFKKDKEVVIMIKGIAFA